MSQPYDLSIARLIWIYFKHRELDELLASSSVLDKQSFSKILVLGLFDILITFPVAIHSLVVNAIAVQGAPFWPGWKAVHSDITVVDKVTAEEWMSSGPGFVSNVRFTQWINPLIAVVFFALFGITEDNKRWYRRIFWKIMKPFGFTPRQDPVASKIVFGSAPAPGSSARGVHTSDS